MKDTKEKDEKFMRLAIKEAELALKDGMLPVGAVIVVDNKIIGIGYKSKNNNYILDHAEMVALKDTLKGSSKSISEMTIYTTLEPCTMCFGAILHSMVSRVVYSLEDPYGGAVHLRESIATPRHEKRLPSVTSGILREEVLGLFKKFFETNKSDFWNNSENPLVKLCLS